MCVDVVSKKNESAQKMNEARRTETAMKKNDELGGKSRGKAGTWEETDV